MYKWLLLPSFLLFSILGYSQTINGYVTDEKNNGLTAVNISILNQSNGVSSNIDGKYNIEIPANRSVVIIYSFIVTIDIVQSQDFYPQGYPQKQWINFCNS